MLQKLGHKTQCFMKSKNKEILVGDNVDGIIKLTKFLSEYLDILIMEQTRITASS